jgi:hypothetical protein
MKPVICLLHAGFLLGFLTNLEDGGDIFFRKDDWNLMDYKSEFFLNTAVRI